MFLSLGNIKYDIYRIGPDMQIEMREESIIMNDINEKYMQLLLAHQIRGITTIGDTHKLCEILFCEKIALRKILPLFINNF